MSACSLPRVTLVTVPRLGSAWRVRLGHPRGPSCWVLRGHNPPEVAFTHGSAPLRSPALLLGLKYLPQKIQSSNPGGAQGTSWEDHGHQGPLALV